MAASYYGYSYTSVDWFVPVHGDFPRGPPLFTILYSLLEISTENLQSLELYNL